MHPQLQEIADDFGAAQARLHRLAETFPAELWAVRPEPGRWSVGDCVDHLNRTAEAFLPQIRAAIERGRALPGPAPARYRRDPLGWLLWRIMPPPVRLRVKTTPAFLPAGTAPAAELVARFDQLQREQLECLAASDGLPLQKLRVPSPFDARVTYNLFSCLGILPRHQHRHLWQAERVVDELRRRRTAAAPVPPRLAGERLAT